MRLKNAIIMAAGLSSRFAPISYEAKGRPEGSMEVLIERPIHQLWSRYYWRHCCCGYKKE